MTREEHISNLETIGCDGWTVTTEAYKSLQFAIKVLKKEPILDKIRAEILKLDDADYDFEGYYKAVTDALAIIDKYRGE